ncbi:DUF354 domain-containing protein [Dehalogenimonas formicexedens]|nr:DUF354 domain-containing protein [Dehalogenimonas formicexedens]
MIHTPAQVHLWQAVATELESRGHHVVFISRMESIIQRLLASYNRKSECYGRVGRTPITRITSLPITVIKSLQQTLRNKPDIIIGTGILESVAGFFTRKPSIIFEDSEPTPRLERLLWYRLCSVVITPSCFRINLGRKQVRVPSYKELAYLYPSRFQPDPAIYDKLGIAKNEKYVILRFNAFDAVHDIGRKGFTLLDKYTLVSELEKFAHVFISSETTLPPDLLKYQLPVPAYQVHQALYHAQLLVSDTQTLTTEAAVLGVPAIRCNSFVGLHDMGNFVELESKYGLLFSFNQPGKAINRAIELITQSDLREEWQAKRKVMLEEKIDLTDYMADSIVNWPESAWKFRASQDKI